tara:strand:+ start:2171 stop:2863 length:693 start_codon:yes stop_codon:yes gene_type:complete
VNREEAQALLPWYVAGTLSREEMQAVQAFVDNGEISAADVDEMRFVGNALVEPGPEEPRYDPQILARVLDRLDDVPQDAHDGEEPLVVVRERQARAAAARRAGPGWVERLRERFQWSMTPPLARAAIAAQFALLLGLTVALTLGGEDAGDAGYETVSGRAVGDYTLTFAPGVSEAQVRTLLLEERASIVAGPSAIGLYTIDFDEGVDTAEAARRLQASGIVTFLQPAPQP